MTIVIEGIEKLNKKKFIRTVLQEHVEYSLKCSYKKSVL